MMFLLSLPSLLLAVSDGPACAKDIAAATVDIGTSVSQIAAATVDCAKSDKPKCISDIAGATSSLSSAGQQVINSPPSTIPSP